MIKNFIKNHTFVFILILTSLVGATSLLAPKIYSASTKENWDEYKEDLTSEGMNRHTTNDFVFALDDILSDQTENEDGSVTQTGALPSLAGVIGTVYATPPASGIYYAYDVFQNLGGKTAYAQGIGFTGLQPILPIWKAFRNITYLLFTLIFIGIGLAIMLRVKISPQAVITINNALPKVIGALILVTFSYAIAGFMIDLMYVLIGLGINVLKLGGVTPHFINIFGLGREATEVGVQKVINWGFFGLIPMFFGGKSGLGAGGSVIGALVGGIIGSILPVGGTLIGIGVGAVLIQVIWGIIALILLFKLFFELIKAYIKIILSVILSPIQIMAGAIPGMQIGGFGKWFKGLLAEILIFPAVVIVAMIGTYILQQINTQPLWTAPLIGPPDLGSTTIQGITGSITNIFTQAIIGMGFLLILPQIPSIIRNALEVESPMGSLIGKSLQPGLSTVAWPFQQTIGQYRDARSEAIRKDQVDHIRDQQEDLLRRNARAIARGLPIIGNLWGRNSNDEN